MYAVFQKICESLTLEDIEKGCERGLVGAEAVRAIVREEVDRTRPVSTVDAVDRVTRIVDNRIDQFLVRHLKSKDLAERITSISRSEARLVHASGLEKLRHELELKITQEVERAIDDLLRSEALTDRIRKVAREAVSGQAASSSAS